MHTLSTSTLSKIIKSLHLLQTRNSKIRLNIIGESDCYGTASDEYSQKRAAFVEQILVSQGVIGSLINTTIKPCINFNNAANPQLKAVSFKVE